MVLSVLRVLYCSRVSPRSVEGARRRAKFVLSVLRWRKFGGTRTSCKSSQYQVSANEARQCGGREEVEVEEDGQDDGVESRIWDGNNNGGRARCRSRVRETT